MEHRFRHFKFKKHFRNFDYVGIPLWPFPLAICRDVTFFISNYIARDTIISYPPVFRYLTERLLSDKIVSGFIYSLILFTNKLQFVAIH